MGSSTTHERTCMSSSTMQLLRNLPILTLLGPTPLTSIMYDSTRRLDQMESQLVDQCSLALTRGTLLSETTFRFHLWNMIGDFFDPSVLHVSVYLSGRT